MEQISDAIALPVCFGLRACPCEALTGGLMLRHLREDGLELLHGILEPSGVEQLVGAVHGRRERVGFGDRRFQCLDEAGELPFGGLRRHESVPLGDRPDRLFVPRGSDALGQRRPELDDLLALAADTDEHPLPLLDHASVHELQLGAHFLEIVEALVRILAHGTQNDDRQPSRDRRIELDRRRWVFRS